MLIFLTFGYNTIPDSKEPHSMAFYPPWLACVDISQPKCRIFFVPFRSYSVFWSIHTRNNGILHFLIDFTQINAQVNSSLWWRHDNYLWRYNNVGRQQKHKSRKYVHTCKTIGRQRSNIQIHVINVKYITMVISMD